MSTFHDFPKFRFEMDQSHSAAFDYAAASVMKLGDNELLQLADALLDRDNLYDFCRLTDQSAEDLLRALAMEAVLAIYIRRIDEKQSG